MDVHTAITVAERAIDDLDAQIAVHVHAIRRLQAQKHLLQQHIRHNKALISLAPRLPPEILATIFELCVHQGFTRTPLAVSHVCSSWRIAAMIPSVWSHLYLDFTRPSHDPIHRARLWLTRSHQTPLTIFLVADQIPFFHNDKLWSLLRTHSPRWKALRITAAVVQTANYVLRNLQAPAPRLSAVSIHVQHQVTPPPDVLPEDPRFELVALPAAFVDAPNLRHFVLSRARWPRPDIIPTSVTELSLQLTEQDSPGTHSFNSLIQVLQQLGSLKTLSLEVPPGGAPQTYQIDLQGAQIPMVELPELTVLVLVGVTDVFAILPCLHLPSLTSLHLRSYAESELAEETGAWIQQFLQHSQPPVSLLEIRDLCLPPHAYGHIFALLPHLKELRLHDSDLTDTELETMIVRADRPAYCSQMQVVDLRWCGRLTGRALVSLVRSRNSNNKAQSVQTIAQVTVLNCSYVREEDILELAEITVCRLVPKNYDDFCGKRIAFDDEFAKMFRLSPSSNRLLRKREI